MSKYAIISSFLLAKKQEHIFIIQQRTKVFFNAVVQEAFTHFPFPVFGVGILNI